MQPLPPEELEKYARQFQTERELIRRGQKLSQEINISSKKFTQNNDVSDRSTVLTALAGLLIDNLARYKVGVDLALLAWTTRNIFEVETILSFVTSSPENLSIFMGDLILDEIEVREAGSMLNTENTDPTVIRKQQEAVIRLKKRKAELGISRNGPTPVRLMAQNLGSRREEEYKKFNKFFSKVVHPTSYFLLGGQLESTNWEAYRLHTLSYGIQRAAKFSTRLHQCK
jgi:hypothetical protein